MTVHSLDLVFMRTSGGFDLTGGVEFGERELTYRQPAQNGVLSDGWSKSWSKKRVRKKGNLSKKHSSEAVREWGSRAGGASNPGATMCYIIITKNLCTRIKCGFWCYSPVRTLYKRTLILLYFLFTYRSKALKSSLKTCGEKEEEKLWVLYTLTLDSFKGNLHGTTSFHLTKSGEFSYEYYISL